MTTPPGKPTEKEGEVLQAIRDNPDQLTLDELARRLFSTPTSVKVMITRLRKKGYPISSPRHRSMAGPRKGLPQTYRLEDKP